ncbi:hypothetical protein Pelo_2885 [Pelomyxa schiedti]|nr:hypothetical protein Pelo_2885 [Pelomyxa schiedti]
MSQGGGSAADPGRPTNTTTATGTGSSRPTGSSGRGAASSSGDSLDAPVPISLSRSNVTPQALAPGGPNKSGSNGGRSSSNLNLRGALGQPQPQPQSQSPSGPPPQPSSGKQAPPTTTTTTTTTTTSTSSSAPPPTNNTNNNSNNTTSRMMNPTIPSSSGVSAFAPHQSGMGIGIGMGMGMGMGVGVGGAQVNGLNGGGNLSMNPGSGPPRRRSSDTRSPSRSRSPSPSPASPPNSSFSPSITSTSLSPSRALGHHARNSSTNGGLGRSGLSLAPPLSSHSRHRSSPHSDSGSGYGGLGGLSNADASLSGYVPMGARDASESAGIDSDLETSGVYHGRRSGGGAGRSAGSRVGTSAAAVVDGVDFRRGATTPNGKNPPDMASACGTSSIDPTFCTPTGSATPVQSSTTSSKPASLFGAPLSVALSPKGCTEPLKMPDIVKKALLFLKIKAPQTAGIFKNSCDLKALKALRTTFEEGFAQGQEVPIPDDTDPHVVAGLLKWYLRCLPDDKLVPASKLELLFQASAQQDSNTCYSEVLPLVEELPPASKLLLRNTMLLLRLVAAHAQVTTCSPGLLAAIFSTIFIPNVERAKVAKAIKLLICRYGGAKRNQVIFPGIYFSLTLHREGKLRRRLPQGIPAIILFSHQCLCREEAGKRVQALEDKIKSLEITIAALNTELLKSGIATNPAIKDPQSFSSASTAELYRHICQQHAKLLLQETQIIELQKACNSSLPPKGTEPTKESTAPSSVTPKDRTPSQEAVTLKEPTPPKESTTSPSTASPTATSPTPETNELKPPSDGKTHTRSKSRDKHSEHKTHHHGHRDHKKKDEKENKTEPTEANQVTPPPSSSPTPSASPTPTTPSPAPSTTTSTTTASSTSTPATTSTPTTPTPPSSPMVPALNMAAMEKPTASAAAPPETARGRLLSVFTRAVLRQPSISPLRAASAAASASATPITASSTTSPVIKPDLPPKAPPKIISPDEAATCIAAVWRGWVVRKQFREIGSKRRQVFEEVFISEQIYCRQISLLEQFREVVISNKLMTTQEIKDVFCNTEKLYQRNMQLMRSLERKFTRWSCVRCIGDICLPAFQAESFGRMYAKFIANYAKSFTTLDHLREKKPKLRVKIEEFEKTNGALLSSFLILPVQRATRYALLFKECVACTPENHPDYANLTKCVEAAQAICATVNEEQVRQESTNQQTQALKELDKILIPKIPELLTSVRHIIAEGAISEWHQGIETPLLYYLLTDMLLLVRKHKKKQLKLLVKCDLRRVRVQDILDEPGKGVFMCEVHLEDSTILILSVQTKEQKEKILQTAKQCAP